MVRTKVFVGNISFKIKAPELKAQFSAAGPVVDVNIITRGSRSLGYGFVEMESEEGANAAIQTLHHKDIDGRQINVELVKEPKEGEEVGPNGEKRERRERKPRVPREGGNDEADATRDNKPRGEPRERRERKPRDPNAPKQEGAAAANPRAPRAEGERKPREPRPERTEGERKPREPRPEGERKPREPREPREAAKPREPREPRERVERPKKSNADRSESDTLLFVANLPFSLDNEAFTKFVTDLNLPIKQAYVVKKHNNRSKGYGFIEFNNQEDQKKGLEKLEGLNIQDRPISVKIALTQAIEPETEGKQEVKPAATGAAQSPKPATPKAESTPKTETAAASPKKEVK